MFNLIEKRVTRTLRKKANKSYFSLDLYFVGLLTFYLLIPWKSLCSLPTRFQSIFTIYWICYAIDISLFMIENEQYFFLNWPIWRIKQYTHVIRGSSVTSSSGHFTSRSLTCFLTLSIGTWIIFCLIACRSSGYQQSLSGNSVRVDDLMNPYHSLDGSVNKRSRNDLALSHAITDHVTDAIFSPIQTDSATEASSGVLFITCVPVLAWIFL